MTETQAIQWLNRKLNITDSISTRFIKLAKLNNRTIVYGISKDFPKGIILTYDKKHEEFEMIY